MANCARPDEVGNECNPAFTGTSWVRLAVMADATHITVNSPVDWKANDHIVVTPTDYLPSHAEEAILAADANVAAPPLPAKSGAAESP